jgi:Holliday junction resolvasome RuvABC endonuclease subunit
MILKKEYTLLMIDPSLKCTGWGVIKVVENEFHDFEKLSLQLLDYGIIDTHGLEHGKSLIKIEKTLIDIVSKYKPDYVSAEQMFAGANRITAMRLANMHGVMQLVCAKAGLNVVYFSVMTAKSTILNGIKTKKQDGTKKSGDEMKQEVSDAVIAIFGEKAFFKEYNLDVTDAISIGITFIKSDGEPPKKVKKSPKKAIDKIIVEATDKPKQIIKKKKTIKDNNKTK